MLEPCAIDFSVGIVIMKYSLYETFQSYKKLLGPIYKRILDSFKKNYFELIIELVVFCELLN